MRGLALQCIQIFSIYEMYVNLENSFETISSSQISCFFKLISLKDSLKCYIETFTTFQLFSLFNSQLNNNYLLVLKYPSILLIRPIIIIGKIDFKIVVIYVYILTLYAMNLICIVSIIIDLKSIRSYISLFIILFDPSGNYRFLNCFFDVWETLLFGKDLVKSFISGISLSTVIGSILQTSRMFGFKNRLKL